MKKKVLFTYNYGREKMSQVEKLGYDITYLDEKSIIYDEGLKDIEILICYNPFATLDITNMKKLKWIQLSSIGIDQLPVKESNDMDIIVTNNKGGYSIPMGEWIIMNILQLSRDSWYFTKIKENKIWKMNTGIKEIFGKTIGFIGTGTIAVETAKRLQGFGTKILGLNTNGKDTPCFHKCYKSTEIDEMTSICDFVIVTIPYTNKTHHLLNRDRLNKLKDGVYIINVARGSIIDEEALIENLKNGRIKGAALDVFEKEPLPLDNPLWNMENVIVTPHNSWISEMRNERRFNLIYENMSRYAKGEKLINVVNTEKGY